MFENKILQLIHSINIEFLEKQKKEGFNIFFKSIINSSHIFIKISYVILLYILFLCFIFMKIFFLKEKNDFFVFKKIINFFTKLYIFRDILKLIKIYSIIFNYDK